MEHSISHHSVSRETFRAVGKTYSKNQEALEAYTEMLLWWNERINLVSRGVSRETISKHIHHSLLISQFPAFINCDYIIDAGTGGGLPGIPLSIVSKGKKFILNDIVTKKILAVKQMVRKQRLSNVKTFDKSIAELKTRNPFLLISKHAFKINNLIELTQDQPWNRLILYKGLSFEEELEGIKEPLNIDVFDLYKENKEPFYKDKAIIIISK